MKGCLQPTWAAGGSSPAAFLTLVVSRQLSTQVCNFEANVTTQTLHFGIWTAVEYFG